MSLWDDDDTVRPPAATTKSASSTLADMEKAVKEAQRSSTTSRTARPQRVTWTEELIHTEVYVEDATKAQADSWREQARRSARDAVNFINAHRPSGEDKVTEVRLRIKVPGWYEGSVPHVAPVDQGRGLFPHAPFPAPASEEQYLTFWRAPFIEHLRELGITVHEEDIAT